MILLDICILAFCGNDSRRRTATLWYFNYYTSPLQAYLLAVVTEILGNSIWSLRCLGPIFTLITIVAIYDIVRQLSAIRARWIACFLVIIPPIVMFSQLCGEVFVLLGFSSFYFYWNLEDHTIRINGFAALANSRMDYSDFAGDMDGRP